MNGRAVLFLILVCGAGGALNAAAVEATLTGRVVITKVMTKKRVTLPAYDLRGAAMNSGKSADAPAVSIIASELSRVVIYLEGTGMKPTAPAQGTMSQKNRRFQPEILVVPAGSVVSFPNEDPIFHNVFSLSKAKEFDLGYYPAGETRTVKFDRPGVVQVYCHIHSDMSAAIVVLGTAVWTRPSADGSYSLSGFPPGNYELVAWHRSAGFFRRKVSLGEGHTSAADFVIPVKESDSAVAPKSGGGR